jgi:serine/threonine protein kinase
MLHRDIKPQNVLMFGEGGVESLVAKLGDLGLACTNETLMSHSKAGTPLYMSPEKGRGDRNYDEKDDMWSVGCILFELLTGACISNISPLGVGITLQVQVTARSPAAESIVTKMLVETRAARVDKGHHKEAGTVLIGLLEALLSYEPQKRPPAFDMLRWLEQLLKHEGVEEGMSLLKQRLARALLTDAEYNPFSEVEEAEQAKEEADKERKQAEEEEKKPKSLAAAGTVCVGNSNPDVASTGASAGSRACAASRRLRRRNSASNQSTGDG